MSHEIRTPINAIIGYADLLDAQIAGSLNSQQIAYLDRVKASSSHLLKLIDDVLDLAKVEAGRMTVEHELNLVVRAVSAALAIIAPLAKARELRIDDHCTDQPDAAYAGDEARVTQVLINLLSNAVKFTEPGGTVTITCGSSAKPVNAKTDNAGAKWTYITVADTGPGIESADLKTIFHPFIQAESGLTRRKDGTGLGLAISGRLAHIMSGDITVESQLGFGSKFTLWLPATLDQSIAPEKRWITEARTNGQRPREFARTGELLLSSIDDILAMYAQRLAAELTFPDKRSGYSELVDHAGSFLADIALALIVLETSEADPASLMRDGTQIQKVISELHGAQRFRLGWAEDTLRADWQILREVIEASVTKANTTADPADIRHALDTLRGMVGYAESISLRGMREAALRAASEHT